MANRKDIGKNPNCYLLTHHIGYQLTLALDEAGVAKQANPNSRPKNSKFKVLKKQRQELMEDFDEGDNDLEEYMRAIGCASIEYDSKMKEAAIDMEEEKLNGSYSSSISSEQSEIVINVSYKPMNGSKL